MVRCDALEQIDSHLDIFHETCCVMEEWAFLPLGQWRQALFDWVCLAEDIRPGRPDIWQAVWDEIRNSWPKTMTLSSGFGEGRVLIGMRLVRWPTPALVEKAVS